MFLSLFPTVLSYFIVCMYFVLEIQFKPGFSAVLCSKIETHPNHNGKTSRIDFFKNQIEIFPTLL